MPDGPLGIYPPLPLFRQLDSNPQYRQRGSRLPGRHPVRILTGLGEHSPVESGPRYLHPDSAILRQVTGRNAPSVINAVFNFANFWDGRANNIFNGVNPFGPLDQSAGIWVNSSHGRW